MKLYFMRHGESESNVRCVFSGCGGNAPLTDRGIEQARALGEKLHGVSFDRVFASNLVRAQMTCETALPGCDYVVDDRIREADMGELEDLSIDETVTRWPDIREHVLSVGDYSSVGGESREDVFNRLRSFLADVEKEHYETVAVFTHAATIRAMFNMVFDTCSYGRIRNGNCLVAVFELKGGKLTLDAWNI